VALALTNIIFKAAHWLIHDPTYNITNEAHHKISFPVRAFIRRQLPR
jgi:hypothetical protein